MQRLKYLRIGKFDLVWNRYLIGFHRMKWEPWAVWTGGFHLGPLQVRLRNDNIVCGACLDDGWLYGPTLNRVPCDCCEAGKKYASAHREGDKHGSQ